MCDYPFFIPQVVLFANSSLFWFKVTNEHREFRNYLIIILIQNRQKRKRKHNIYTTKYVKKSGEIRLEALS